VRVSGSRMRVLTSPEASTGIHDPSIFTWASDGMFSRCSVMSSVFLRQGSRQQSHEGQGLSRQRQFQPKKPRKRMRCSGRATHSGGSMKLVSSFASSFCLTFSLRREDSESKAAKASQRV